MSLHPQNHGGARELAPPDFTPFLRLEARGGRKEPWNREAQTEDPWVDRWKIMGSTTDKFPPKIEFQFLTCHPYRVERRAGETDPWEPIGGCVVPAEGKLCFYIDEGYCVLSLYVVMDKKFLFGFWSPDLAFQKQTDPVGAWVAEAQGPEC
jgi:hypothetical protein